MNLLDFNTSPESPEAGLLFEEGVAGIDEAGRGPLAGPVVAAAVILPSGFDTLGLDDSKKLTSQQREEWAEKIRFKAHWGLAIVGPSQIDRTNILQATFQAMLDAYLSLPMRPTAVRVDGNQVPPGIDVPCSAWVKGDSRHTAIAAASILAKTERDSLMRGFATLYPGYGFERHFGYASPEHLEAIERLGPCPLHRMSFRPLRKDEQACLTFDA
ncbi:MAG: ribonuclease HII [Fimbriimonadaceae bacterium]|nr:MAG: RNase HII [Armatimonadetes bacterium OLB18]MBV6490511.1 Ribonuclease HII [Fimbriimonadaceae bacterium]MCZ7581522.1 ribonuclease HII [Fimbriimonadaceae bacterium]RIJ98626.1 MAG: ribonuclease HII [Armatimonadota bacterium]WKZ79947.1 MAG: ribonuclease HII [Fimbriimonadaceae bacterium]